jgi:hypothetical protein
LVKGGASLRIVAKFCRIITLLIAIASGTAVVWAHQAQGSAVMLDLHDDRVVAELTLPLAELGTAVGVPLAADPATAIPRYRDLLAGYLGQHVAARVPEGGAWRVVVRDFQVLTGSQPADLVATLELRPPAGASLRRFILQYDVVTRESTDHVALVSVRSDWRNALLGDQPELLGALHSGAREITVDRDLGSAWRGFWSVLRLGLRHIAEGTDHLMFLFVLLLPAPLLVSDRRWGGYGGFRSGCMRLARIVTAFTAGHSLTLLLATVGWVQVPSRPVEILIAGSILVAAGHAVRPLFAGREAVLAGGFGLVHGLAFAGVLAEFHLDAWHLAAALLAFNLGIEIMQLALVFLAVPALMLLSRTPLYPWLRGAGALFGGAAALGWIAERAVGWPNPLNAAVDALAAHAPSVVSALTILGVILTMSGRRERPGATARTASGPEPSN